jgi:hypothetical protein
MLPALLSRNVLHQLKLANCEIGMMALCMEHRECTSPRVQLNRVAWLLCATVQLNRARQTVWPQPAEHASTNSVNTDTAVLSALHFRSMHAHGT